jgi:hypothetical protein
MRKYAVVPQSGAVTVPKEIPFDRACLIGCGVMTGVGAALRLAPVAAGASVAVIGCGAGRAERATGRAARQCRARSSPSTAPGAAEPVAPVFGADLTTGEPGDDVVAFVKQHTAGRGADYVFEAAGQRRRLPAGRRDRAAGRAAGVPRQGQRQPGRRLPLGRADGGEEDHPLELRRCAAQRDFPWLARCYLEGKLKLDELITCPPAAVSASTRVSRPCGAARESVPWSCRGIRPETPCPPQSGTNRHDEDFSHRRLAGRRNKRNGYHFPLDVLSEAETRVVRAKLEAHEAATGGPISGDRRHKPHLYLTFLNDLIHHPRILDAVEDVLGPNLLCWSTSFFIKEASDPASCRGTRMRPTGA